MATPQSDGGNDGDGSGAAPAVPPPPTAAERSALRAAIARRAVEHGAAEYEARNAAWERLCAEVLNHSSLFHEMAYAEYTGGGGNDSQRRAAIATVLQSGRQVLDTLRREFAVERLAALDGEIAEMRAAIAAATAGESGKNESKIDNKATREAAAELGERERYAAKVRAYDPTCEFVLAAHFEPTAAAPTAETRYARLRADADAHFWMCECCGAKTGRGDAPMPGRCVCELCSFTRYCSDACRERHRSVHVYRCAPRAEADQWKPMPDPKLSTEASVAAASSSTTTAK